MRGHLNVKFTNFLFTWGGAKKNFYLFVPFTLRRIFTVSFDR